LGAVGRGGGDGAGSARPPPASWRKKSSSWGIVACFLPFVAAGASSLKVAAGAKTRQVSLLLDVVLGSDASLAAGLGPLLGGEFGLAARELWLCCLARRLAAGGPVRGALLPGLADAMWIARGGQH
jgi:hypothetical protein